MRVLTSWTDEAVESTDFTVIVYAGEHSLAGDAAVGFRQQDDGMIEVTVQTKPAGPFATTKTMTKFVVRPWTD